MPAAARQQIYRVIAQSHCEGIMVESLPQFITPKAIAEAKAFLGKKRLFVGIGLQSADDLIRSVCINTTCTKGQFEHASHLLWENGYTPKVYLMVKPPFLTEREAVTETSQSIRYVADLGYSDATICPTRIAPHTIVAELAKRGMYSSPSLWTIVDILNEVNSTCSIRIACLDINGQDADTIYPRTCISCTPVLLNALEKFNIERDLTAIATLSCFCRENHLADMEVIDNRPLAVRVYAFLDQYSTKDSVAP
jgi:radical SAM enzyme (TIGR01210 family)